MVTVYIGYDSQGKLNLFASEESQTPCSDHFDVAYNSTEPFDFKVKPSVTNVIFASSPPVKWFDAAGTEISRPGNISAPQLSPASAPRTLSFSDSNTTAGQIEHRFTLQMLDDGTPATIGFLGTVQSSKSGPGSQESQLIPVDPTIIDKGDQGSEGTDPFQPAS